MKNEIKTIYDNGNVRQYYKKGWQCETNEIIPMTLIVEVINMCEATGEDEWKDYPVTFSIGILNKNIHESLREEDRIYEDKIYPNTVALLDVIGYYGLLCYLEQAFLDTDNINSKIIGSLSIYDACLYTYEDRFTKTDKQFIKFKTEEKALEFSEKLIHAYGNAFMTFIGYQLDKPVNLMGVTGWRNVDLFNKGV